MSPIEGRRQQVSEVPYLLVSETLDTFGGICVMSLHGNPFGHRQGLLWSTVAILPVAKWEPKFSSCFPGPAVLCHWVELRPSGSVLVHV